MNINCREKPNFHRVQKYQENVSENYSFTRLRETNIRPYWQLFRIHGNRKEIAFTEISSCQKSYEQCISAGIAQST
jgi:hypothetical protein